MKVVGGEVEEVHKSGDVPKELFVTLNGHSGDHDNVGMSISLPARTPQIPDSKEVKPE